MSKLNRDVIVAIFLLVLCGVFFWASGQIKDMGYETIGAEVWPRFILVALLTLTLIYLFQSLRLPPKEGGEGGGLMGWVFRYRNALWCYALFFVFLITLPWLGMLIGASLFVFAALTVLGERTLRAHGIHAVIAVTSISVMWAIFTFGLRVILPEGEILRIW